MSTSQLPSKVLVCQNTTCKQQGSKQVLAAFERCVPPEVVVEASGCLGQCGNGPTVIVLQSADVDTRVKPTWYAKVTPTDAFRISAQHFQPEKLSTPERPQTSSQSNFFWIWLVGLVLFFSMCALMALVLGGPTHYG
ncbi:MAG: (2Fe-2S) ferredoxin domain-containing protein [Cyanobacteria bacterium J06560_2]